MKRQIVMKTWLFIGGLFLWLCVISGVLFIGITSITDYKQQLIKQHQQAKDSWQNAIDKWKDFVETKCCKLEVVTETPKDEATLRYEGKHRVHRRDDGVWVYHIKRGDTLTHISRHLGVSVDELGELNKIRDLNKINENAYLVLP